MSSFVTSSACRGQRPSGLVARHQYERPHIIARLLKDRRVARFVVAPDGFGKTSLVFEYADMMFSFKHVFWIKCGSPCFIRDLDRKSLVEDILAVDRSVALVVFEDLPPFGAERSLMFASAIDALLETGCEVVVTCTPARDAYAGLQRDRLLVSGSDLLLQDFELRTRVPKPGAIEEDPRMTPRAERLACLKWREGGEHDFVSSIGAEELPGDVSLVLFAMLVFGRGELAGFSAFVSEKRLPEVLRILASGYPYLGIDLSHGVFESVAISVEALASGCAALLERAVVASHYGSKNELVGRLADALIARGAYDRAIDLIANTTSRTGALDWLVSRGWDLVLCGAAGPAYRLYDKIARDPAHENPALCALSAWAAYVLEDHDNALALAKRVLAGRASADFEKVMACLLLIKAGDSDLCERACDGLAALLSASAGGRLSRAGAPDLAAGVFGEAWVAYARLFLACAESAGSGLAEWKSIKGGVWSADSSGARPVPSLMARRETVLALGGVHVIQTALQQRGLLSGRKRTKTGESLKSIRGQMLELTDFLRSRFAAGRRAKRPVGWLDLEVLQVLGALAEEAPGLIAGDLPTKEEQPFRAAYSSLVLQRAAYARARAEKERRMREFCEMHPDPFRREIRVVRPEGSSLRSVAPPLRVNLFGSFGVKVGDHEVGDKLIRHRKAKILLAALVMARGREVSRDYLAGLLWPDSSPTAAKKNLYAVWVQLAKALEVEGSCPYLIRDKSGCRIDARLLSSDVEEYEALCRLLLVGKVEDWEWESLFIQVSELSSRDLMPGEEDNDYLCRQRDRYRLNLTDSLVFASSRLLQAGELQGSLWFAREAWHRDRMREDACMALMRAQLASGQRGSAIESFFMLKQCLAEELGLDPSPRILDLYGSILAPEAIPA